MDCKRAETPERLGLMGLSHCVASLGAFGANDLIAGIDGVWSFGDVSLHVY
jgi:hypothetical protein